MKKRFDQKFGKAFFESIPAQPGVYRFLDAQGTVLYVGKAKNLRRRLSQYRNARRRKAHRKMRTLVEVAEGITWEILQDETSALLEETRLIQELRPKWNVAGAFSFLYPYLGIVHAGHVTQIYLTHRPAEHLPGQLFGCYRSLRFTQESFDALDDLLSFLAPRLPRREKQAHAVWGVEGWVRPNRITAFKGLNPQWLERLRQFLREGYMEALQELLLELSDVPAARRASKRVQECLNTLKYFRKWEVMPLQKVLRTHPDCGYPMGQKDRDVYFILHRSKKTRLEIGVNL
jgi:hypothetical protein